MLSGRRQAQFGLAAAAIIFLIAVSIVIAGAFDKPNFGAGLVGSPAAAFRLPDLSAKMVSLSSLRGSVTVLCVLPGSSDKDAFSPNLKRLGQLAQHYSSNSDVKVIAIRSNSDELSSEHLRALRDAENGSGCTTLLDPTGLVARRFAIDGSPTFLILDGSGIIRYRGGIDDPSPDAPLASTSFANLIDLLLAERPLPGQPAPAVLSKIK